MLYAKISPSGKTSRQISPLEIEVVESGYITAYARPYGAGSSNVNFEIVFGNIIIKNELSIFERVFSTNIIMLSDEFVLWGIDDSIILSNIATKIGTTAIDFVTIDDNIMPLKGDNF